MYLPVFGAHFETNDHESTCKSREISESRRSEYSTEEFPPLYIVLLTKISIF